jgi:hypothetical protein
LIEEGSDLSLEKAIEIGLTMEMSQTHMKTLAEEDRKVLAVKVKQAIKREKPQNSQPTRNSTSKTPECEHCGYNEHNTIGNQCPAKGKQCKKCLKYNHFARVCKSSTGRKVQEVDKDEDETFFIGHVYYVNAVKVSEWQEEYQWKRGNSSARHRCKMQCHVI